MTVTATYDPADNKIRVSSLHRFDRETYDRLKAAGFSWAPKQELFVAPMWTPEREDLACELADSGELEDEDTTLAERAEERAERFSIYQDKRAEDAERTHEAAETMAEDLAPAGGVIGRGNWRAARKAHKNAERLKATQAKAVRLWETSEYWERRAKGAIHHAKYKELPGVRARRIRGLEADERKHVRERSLAMDALKLWSAMPEGPATDGGRTPAATRALFLANLNIGTSGTWSDLCNSVRQPWEVQAGVLENLPKVIERHERWLRHIALRLAYERELLAADGYVEPVKARRARDLGPMCNWPAPGAEHMTKAEMKARYHEVIHLGGTGPSAVAAPHRQYGRVDYARGGRVLFYLTDQKRKDPPAKEQVETQEETAQ